MCIRYQFYFYLIDIVLVEFFQNLNLIDIIVTKLVDLYMIIIDIILMVNV